jgi:hypothetical protein
MEVIIDLFNKKKESDITMIQKAINHGVGMLHINDFIKVTGFELNEILPVDTMWNTFQRGIPIYITNELIAAFGYKGELKKQKANLLKLIRKYDIPIVRLDNKNYENFIRTPERPYATDTQIFYPEIDKSRGKTLHYLIMPHDFKKLLIVVDTENGKLAREYVVKLDDLFHLYLKYQIEYEKNRNYIAEKHYNRTLAEMKEIKQALTQKLDEQSQKIDDMKETIEVQHEVLEEVNSKLDKSTDERAPRTKNTSKHEKFVIAKISSSGESNVYYSIRCQNTIIKRTIKKLKTKYPHMITIIEISYQPNSKNLYNLMKENLADKIIVKGNVIHLTNNYREEEFIQDIQALDSLKKEIETDEE